MYLTVEEAMSLLCSLSEAKKMKVAIKYRRRKSIFIASFGTAIGSWVGGPPGFAIGSAFGGALGALVWSKKFKPVSQVLKELPPDEQEKLRSQIRDIISKMKWKDVKDLTKQVMGSEDLQERLLALLVGYITKEQGVTVQYGD